MTQSDVNKIVTAQKEFFYSGATLDVKFRIQQLKKLKNAVIANQQKLTDALVKDLGRTQTEAFLCDVGVVIAEINETIKGLKRWAKPEIHFSGITCFPSIITKVYKMPYGVTLIMSPFNFPVLLSLGVLTASISGGNTAVLKVSSKSTECSKVTAEIISQTFPKEYIAVIQGDHDIADMCLEENFDKIFYTGSPKVAKKVLLKASEHITPVALELGGETGNWAVIRKDADLADAAEKIAFFKLLNSGQICINVNQVAVAEEVSDKFIQLLKAEFTKQIGENAVLNDEYPHLINKRAYDKCREEAELYRDKIIYGGFGDEKTLKYSPTIIYPAEINSPIVNHELFCPLLPVVTFKDENTDELLKTISAREKPLAFYLFTKNVKWAERVMQTMQYGGGCINEVCYHMLVKGVPFNGTGHSGMGAYHGEWGFKEFTHPSTVLFGSTHFNLSLRKHPYEQNGKKTKLKFIKRFFK